MSNLTPAVAIVMPNFNTPEAHLKDSFESLRQQTFTDYVCVVVDESDDTVLADACEK